MTVLACGPYTGDFEQELFNFRPYVRWISKIAPTEHIFLSTHFNRAFLYDWIEPSNFIPVFEDLSRSELSQQGLMHSSLQLKDHNLLTKIFKEKVIEKSGSGKREIAMVNLTYSKNGNTPLYNKVFRPISIPPIRIEKKKIVYIPDLKEKKKRVHEIYNHLTKHYDVTVVGDFKTHLCEENVVLKKVDYFENGYKYIVKIISEADVVVCPLGHWTLLCNMQKVPVFSWGETPSLFIEGGVYNMGNKNARVASTDSDTPSQTIFDLSRYFIERVLTS